MHAHLPFYIAFNITKISNLVQSLNLLLAHHHKLPHLGLKTRYKKKKTNEKLPKISMGPSV